MALQGALIMPVRCTPWLGPIPQAAEWAGYAADRDVCALHGQIFGASLEFVQAHLAAGNALRFMEGLLFAPRAVFRYYIHAFAAYLQSPQAVGDADAAAAFLVLLNARERCDPGSVCQIYLGLSEHVDYVVARQEIFGADAQVYGCFLHRAARICDACRHTVRESARAH